MWFDMCSDSRSSNSNREILFHVSICKEISKVDTIIQHSIPVYHKYHTVVASGLFESCDIVKCLVSR